MRQFFAHYSHYYREYIPHFLLAFLGVALSSGGTSAIAYLVKPVLDEIFIKNDTKMLSLLPFALMAAYFAKGGGAYLQAYFVNYIGRDIVRRTRDKTLSHLLSLDISFFGGFRSGELISRLTGDIARIQSAVSSLVADFTREVLTVVGLIGVVVYMSPKLAFYGLVVLPVAFYPLSLLARRMKKISFKSQEKNSDIAARLAEVFNNVEIIKAHHAEEYETKRFMEHSLAAFNIEMKGVKTSEAVNPMMELLGSFAAAGVIVIGGAMVIDKSLSVGEFFSFMTALFMLYTPVRQISSIYNKFQDAIAANERIQWLLSLQPSIKSGEKAISKSVERVQFQDVSLTYEKEKPALSSINLTLQKGECTALVGSSGAGKSSLVSLLLRFYNPSGGRVLFDGEDIKDFTLGSLRSKVAIVTQRVYIFNESVAANVAYGKQIDEQKVRMCLKAAHALSFVETMEHGIFAELSEFGSNLSGGQRQRIAIARALYSEPDIFVFDEATSALDNESEQEISKAIAEIAKEKIVVLIAHRLSSLKIASKIAVLKDGRMICEGSEEHLLKSCEEYQKLYQKGEAV